MRNVLRAFSIILLLVVNTFANVHDDLVLLNKLYQEKDYYKAKELAERLVDDPSANFYANLVLSDIDFLEGNLYSSKSRLEKLLEKYPEKKDQLQKRLERIEKEEAFLRDVNKNQFRYFKIIWKTTFKNQKVYEDIENIFMEAYQRGGKFFGWYPDEIIEVLIYSSKEYETYTIMPHWSQGGYDGKIRLMIYENIGYKQLLDLIFHEYAHAAISYITKGNCPTWLNEGIAQYFASVNSGSLSFRTPKRSFKEIPNNWNGLKESEIKELYQESLSLVGLIISKTDDYVIQRILENLGKRMKIEPAIDDAVSIYGYNSKTIFND
ncbi:MAG: hypothetical protein N2202_09365 [Proteobacteria bacterium]|nr:hypothetical protein [Pseudomonadota bacterium]